jgi:SET domain-containing protein
MQESGPHYVADLDPNKSWICGKYLGNWTKMVNHHCTKANCKLYRFKEEDGSYSLGLWTIKNIKATNGLFYHYGDDDSEHIGEPIQCLCEGVDSNNIPICNHNL